MLFTDLDLKKIKKTFGFKSASFRYHNKHKDGSGNFGTNLTKGTWQSPDWENWEISGDYDNVKRLYVLRFGSAYKLGYKVTFVNDLDELIIQIDRIMKEEKEFIINRNKEIFEVN